jgi:hypothetical protein
MSMSPSDDAMYYSAKLRPPGPGPEWNGEFPPTRESFTVLYYTLLYLEAYCVISLGPLAVAHRPLVPSCRRKLVLLVFSAAVPGPDPAHT